MFNKLKPTSKAHLLMHNMFRWGGWNSGNIETYGGLYDRTVKNPIDGICGDLVKRIQKYNKF